MWHVERYVLMCSKCSYFDWRMLQYDECRWAALFTWKIHGMCTLGMGILGLSDFVDMFWTWYVVFQASCLLCKEPSHIPLRCEEVEKVCPYALYSLSLVYVSVCNIFKENRLPSWMIGSHIHITKLLIKGKKVDKLKCLSQSTQLREKLMTLSRFL
jgi:hypothetical protein